MLIAHMGGAIGFHPAPERGSVFWFSLPRAERRGAKPQSAKSAQDTAATEEAATDAAAAHAKADEPESVACAAPAPA
jgi:hypothetical protein